MERKEKLCMTCLWWGGEEADETAFCDEKEIDTGAGDHCPRWSKKPELSETMTEAQKQELWELVEKGCTDSKVEDFWVHLSHKFPEVSPYQSTGFFLQNDVITGDCLVVNNDILRHGRLFSFPAI